jgi:hypothetical protein
VFCSCCDRHASLKGSAGWGKTMIQVTFGAHTTSKDILLSFRAFFDRQLFHVSKVRGGQGSRSVFRPTLNLVMGCRTYTLSRESRRRRAPKIVHPQASIIADARGNESRPEYISTKSMSQTSPRSWKAMSKAWEMVRNKEHAAPRNSVSTCRLPLAFSRSDNLTHAACSDSIDIFH